jgi:signal peptidase I
MRRRATRSQSLAGALALGALVLGWFFLAPSWLGGRTNYVVTEGISMQPRFHSGDLAVVRAAADYRVGEIVAYRSRMLHTIVLHRIIGRDGDRYVFKGDNNNFRDPEHPTRSQLVGRLWLHVPGGGRWLGVLHAPLVMAILAGLLAFGVLFTGGVKARRGRRPGQEPSARPVADSVLSNALLVAGGAFVVFAILGAVAVSRPVSVPVSQTVGFTQTGGFSYSARTQPSAVYPEGVVVTSDPVFLRLVDRLDVRFRYRFGSDVPTALAGTGRLAAEVSSSAGWKRTLPLGPVKRFRGTSAVLAGSLDLRALQRLAAQVDAATGVAGSSYTVTLAPRIAAQGTVDGSPLRTSFAPRLDFSMDELQLLPTLTGSNGKPTVLHPSLTGSVDARTSRPRLLDLRVLHPRVSTARALAGLGLLASLLALLGCQHLLLRRPKLDEAARIEARYSHLIVPVARVRASADAVEVASMEELVRIAERYDRLILHDQSQLGHVYWIPEDGVDYLFPVLTARIQPSPPVEAAEPEPVRQDDLAA